MSARFSQLQKIISGLVLLLVFLLFPFKTWAASNYLTIATTTTSMASGDVGLFSNVSSGSATTSYFMRMQKNSADAFTVDDLGNRYISGSLTMAGGSASSLSAANVSMGSFGSNTAAGNYSFPSNLNISSYLGVGTTTAPAVPLDVTAPVNTEPLWLRATAGYEIIRFKDLSGTDRAWVGNDTGSNFSFKNFTSGGNLSLITTGAGYVLVPNGNVGIGTSTPAAKLHILAPTGSGTSYNAFLAENNQGDYQGFKYITRNGTGTYLANNVLFEDARPSTAGTVGSFFTIYRSGTLATGTVFQVGNSTAASSLVVDANGYVGIGTTTPRLQLDLNGSFYLNRPATMVDSGPTIGIPGSTTNGLIFAPSNLANGQNGYFKFSFPDTTSVRFNSDYDGHLTGSIQRDIQFGNNSTVILDIKSTGAIGIGTTSPTTAQLVVATSPTNYAVDVNNYRIGNVGTPVSPGDAVNLAYLISSLASSTASSTLGSTGLNFGGTGNITGVNKLTVTTIDPLYQIDGVKYSSFAGSIVGGVKEEYIGRLKIDRLQSVGTKKEYEYRLDFSQLSGNSDLWVWRQVVDFSPENVDVNITPYGSFASTYYLIEDNAIIFRADHPVEISYRLSGKRQDWQTWPTKAKNQQENASFVINNGQLIK